MTKHETTRLNMNNNANSAGMFWRFLPLFDDDHNYDIENKQEMLFITIDLDNPLKDQLNEQLLKEWINCDHNDNYQCTQY